MAEGVGFEPTVRFRTPVFKTGALNRSATLPAQYAKKNRRNSYLCCHFSVHNQTLQQAGPCTYPT